MGIRQEKDFPGGKASDWSDLPPLDFRSRDTLVMGGGMPILMNPKQAWTRASTDGGRTWRPHRLVPNWDFPGLSMPGTSMYSVREDGVMLFGMQARGGRCAEPDAGRLRQPRRRPVPLSRHDRRRAAPVALLGGAARSARRSISTPAS
ncbi:MAG: hypothetical protein WDN24_19890 [Sphingomonas sp.]